MYILLSQQKISRFSTKPARAKSPFYLLPSRVRNKQTPCFCQLFSADLHCIGFSLVPGAARHLGQRASSTLRQRRSSITWFLLLSGCFEVLSMCITSKLTNVAFCVSSRRVLYLYTLVLSFISMFNVYDLRLARELTVDFNEIDNFGKLLRKELKINPVDPTVLQRSDDLKKSETLFCDCII